MPKEFLTRFQTPLGEVIVLTKTRFMFLFNVPRTSVMPSEVTELGNIGVQFRWTTSDAHSLESLHNLLVQTLHQVTLPELRYVANLGKWLMSWGQPFVADDAPVPDCLKEISKHVRLVI